MNTTATTTYSRAFDNGYRATYFRGRPSSPTLCASIRDELAYARRSFHAHIGDPPTLDRHKHLAYQLGVIHALTRLLERWEPFPHLNAPEVP